MIVWGCAKGGGGDVSEKKVMKLKMPDKKRREDQIDNMRMILENGIS